MVIDEKAVFVGALAMPDAKEREVYLQEACAGHPELLGRLRELLSAHDESQGPLDRRPAALGDTVDAALTEGPGSVIGPYKLLQQIGEGGMGTVFMAEQTQPVQRKVALKVIKAGMDSRQVIARFEAERQALAMMDHVNIARVLDVGATEAGRPYFVMELVHGVPITRYCDDNHLTPRERLELFVPVCQAIQHAHQKGIIHRDIKPSNVMITLYDGKPVPKVIDFGVAKATEQKLTERTLFTQYGTMVGTLEYMSPEQAEMSALGVDTRSDIFSLGVLLYELLTGSTPVSHKRLKEAGYAEILRIIKEEEAPKPSTRLSESGAALASISTHRHMEPAKLTKLMRGELDWIVLKTLEKDRNRRYETASAFAADVQRYLTDEPVLACPPSAWYKFRKLARRNKAVLATASAVGLAVLLAVGSLVWAVMVLADTNTQIKQEQKQTTEALGAEQQAKEDLVRALYFQRIASAERELATKNAARAEEQLDECPFHLRGWEWHYLKRLRYQPPLTFTGHGNWVLGVAFSPDGKQVASASMTFFGALGEIKVWDRATGKVLHTLFGHAGPAVGVAYSPDGKRLASAGWDRTVNVWDAATGKLLHTLSGHTEYVSCVAFSPDGKLLASGSGDRTVKVWDAIDFQELRALVGHRGGLYGIAFSPDSKLLASASGDRTVRLWDAAAGEELHTLQGHSGPVLSVAFSPDGGLLASAGGEGAVKLWDVAARRHARTIRTDVALATSVAFSPDGQRLAAGGWGKAVQVWEAATGQEALTLRGHEEMVTGVAFSPDGLQIASASLDTTVRVWDAAPLGTPVGPAIRTLRGHSDGVIGVAWRLPDGKLLASASFDGTVRLWDTDTGKEVRTLRGHTGPVGHVAFSRDGRRLASADIAGVVKVWDALSGWEVRTFRGYSVGVALSPDGRRLATALEGGLVYVWDAEMGNEVIRPFRAHDAPVICLAFSPDGKRLATGSWDKTAKVWDAATGRQLCVLRGHSHIVYGLGFSPDGKRLATASWDKTAKVWDAATGKELLTLRGHQDRVLSVCFSPDGKRLATASWNNTAKVWDAANGKEIVTLDGHSGYVMSVAFSPDGRRLATASGYRGKGEITIWDATRWDEKPK